MSKYFLVNEMNMIGMLTKVQAVTLSFLMNVVLCTVALLGTSTSHAGIITIEKTIDKDAVDSYNCFDLGADSKPCLNFYWNFEPFDVQLAEDTVVVKVNFADNWRLRWQNLPLSYTDSQRIQVGLTGPDECCSASNFTNKIEFLDVTGDLNFNDFSWDGSNGGSGGMGVWFGYEQPRLTDSWFEFSGFVSTIYPRSNSTTVSANLASAHVFLMPGDFSFHQTAEQVSSPATSLLFLTALCGLVRLRRQ